MMSKCVLFLLSLVKALTTLHIVFLEHLKDAGKTVHFETGHFNPKLSEDIHRKRVTPAVALKCAYRYRIKFLPNRDHYKAINFSHSLRLEADESKAIHFDLQKQCINQQSGTCGYTI